MKKIIAIIYVLISTTVLAQQPRYAFYLAGKTETLPNIQLYLCKDGSYDLKIFGRDCWFWEFYKGAYYFEPDSLVLVYETFYPEPLCQIIDTFHKVRTLKLLYQNEENKVLYHLSIDLNHDTTNVGYFPIEYVDTAIATQQRARITYTYYAPYFTSRTKTVRFYKPKKKPAQTYLIKFKIDGKVLKPSDRFRKLFAPFETLHLQ